MTRGNACAECGEDGADFDLICPKCRPLYPVDKPLVTDECDCPSCRSDMARIAPCMRIVK